jgi:hypothetical protein
LKAVPILDDSSLDRQSVFSDDRPEITKMWIVSTTASGATALPASPSLRAQV